MPHSLQIKSHQVVVNGKFIRTGKLKDEFYDFIRRPCEITAELKQKKLCDLFTFIQEIPERTPQFDYYFENDSLAVLQISTYEHWWKKQINDKIRNMVRKGAKCGLDIREVELDDAFVSGIARISNETPIRQGRYFKHYGKPHEVVKSDHSSFLNRSEFLGAYFQGELVGYIKLVHGRGISNIMQILAMNAHRDKSPTNALLARAIEICAERKVPLLQYGSWSRRTMGEFKKRHGFERWETPRYFVPITLTGHLLFRCNLHRNWINRLPEPLLDRGAMIRSRFNSIAVNIRRPSK